MSTITSSNTDYTQNGVTYTTNPTNDQLSNEDFITLMLTELSMQDPTKPVDSSSMMDNQLQLSTLEANIAMTESMQEMSQAYAQSSLSNSANLIGRIVQSAETNEDGSPKQYQISSVSSIDGEVYLKGYEIIGYDDVYYFEPVDDASSIENGNDEGDSITITNASGTEYSFSTNGKSYEELATEINETDGLAAEVLETAEGQQQLVIAVGNGGSTLSQNGVELNYSTDQNIIYNSEIALLPYDNVTDIY